MNLLKRIARAILPPILAPRSWFSVYEGANFSNRRGFVPGVTAPTDNKLELHPYARRELVRRSRYLNKNSGFAREVVADMAMYSIGDGIWPQAQSSNHDWNRKAEQYFNQWGRLCDLTNRFHSPNARHWSAGAWTWTANISWRKCGTASSNPGSN